MPTLTTQSIGAASTPLVTSPISAQATRASQTSVAAGVQAKLNQSRANESATEVKPSKKRSIQEEARAEGIFGEEHSEPDNSQAASQSDKQPQGKLSRVA